MTENNFDLVVIGGGPGGYVCAIRAAQLGMKVACVEARGTLGGTCLNVGCIPSKALLESSERYEQALHGMSQHGIKLGKVELDLPALMRRKSDVVDSLAKGIEGLFRKNKVSYFKGLGKIVSANKVEVLGENNATLIAQNIVIATGSEVTPLPGVEIDEKVIVSSTGALSLSQVPKRMVVIGGGVIGLELGSVWKRLGAEVTVVEFLDKIVPSMDQEVGRNLQKVLEKQGIKFLLGRKVVSVAKGSKSVIVLIESVQDKTQEEIESDVVLVAIGRRPYTKSLGLEELSIVKDNRGYVQVDSHFRTNIPSIFAIGDCITGPMLAHKAEEEGVAVAEILAGQAGHVNYDAIPSVVYTWPEVASVGKTEEELKDASVEYKVGKFPFMANSRARAVGDHDGFVKIIACPRTDRVYGVHIIGPQAGTMIAEAVLAMEYHASSEDIARTCHAHPTLNEAMKEAALAVASRQIHS